MGEPSARFARPCVITEGVPGEPADRAPVTRGRYAAGALAGFLRALHREAPAGAPVGRTRAVALRTLTRAFDEAFPTIDGIGEEVRDVWEDAVSAPEWRGPPVWVHGDLHPANVVTAGGTLAGVLDFGIAIGRAGDLGLPGGKVTWGPAGRPGGRRSTVLWRTAGARMPVTHPEEEVVLTGERMPVAVARDDLAEAGTGAPDALKAP
jgi:hypothetical protein